MAGLTVSAFCQQLVRGVKIKYPVLQPNDSHQMIMELGRIGGNINQIAQKMNKGSTTKEVEEDIKQVRADVRKMWEFIVEKRR